MSEFRDNLRSHKFVPPHPSEDFIGASSLCRYREKEVVCMQTESALCHSVVIAPDEVCLPSTDIAKDADFSLDKDQRKPASTKQEQIPDDSSKAFKQRIREEISLMKGWYDGSPDSSIIEELAARNITQQDRVRELEHLSQDLATERDNYIAHCDTLKQQLKERDAQIVDWKSKYEGAKLAFNSACNAEENIRAEGRKAGIEEAAVVAETEMHQWDGMEANITTAIVTAIRALADSEKCAEKARIFYDSHVHSSLYKDGELTDKCGYCGKDFRDSIHLQYGETRHGRIAALANSETEKKR